MPEFRGVFLTDELWLQGSSLMLPVPQISEEVFVFAQAAVIWGPFKEPRTRGAALIIDYSALCWLVPSADRSPRRSRLTLA